MRERQLTHEASGTVADSEREREREGGGGERERGGREGRGGE